MKFKEKVLAVVTVTLVLLVVGLLAYPDLEFSNNSFSITGSVLDENKPFSNVSLKFFATDPEGGKDILLLETFSDADGNFSLNELPFDANYKLVPSFEGKFFSPSQYSINAPAADAISIPELNGPYIFETTSEENVQAENDLPYYGYIVQFDEPSLLEKKQELEDSNQRSVGEFSEEQQLEIIQIQRNNVLSSLFNPGQRGAGEEPKVIGSVEHVLNAVILNISDEEAESLRGVAGVKEVFKNYKLPPESAIQTEGESRSLAFVKFWEMVNADKAYQVGFTGTGSAIAVIDDGFDGSHEVFGIGNCQTNDIPFVNCGKIRGAINFADSFDLNGNGTFEACYRISNGEAGEKCENNFKIDWNSDGDLDDCFVEDNAGAFCEVKYNWGDPYSHGTGVASVAVGNAPGKYQGTAFGANLYLFPTRGTGSLSGTLPAPLQARDGTTGNIITALNTIAANLQGKVKVINISLGVNYHAKDPVALAAENISRNGFVVVSGVGNKEDISCFNKGNKSSNCIGSPAVAPEVIAVGATDNSGTRIASFSGRGPGCGDAGCSAGTQIQDKPNISAPGEDIPIANNGTYSANDGTSFASPIVAGAAQIIFEAAASIGYANISNQKVKELLYEGAKNLEGEPKTAQGAGQLNIFASLPRKVSVVVEGSGKVNVTTQPESSAVIDCGSKCTDVFPNGTQIRLSAVPLQGAIFDKWEGDCVPSVGNSEICMIEPGSEEEINQNKFSLIKNIKAKFVSCDSSRAKDLIQSRGAGSSCGEVETGWLDVSFNFDARDVLVLSTSNPPNAEQINCSDGNGDFYQQFNCLTEYPLGTVVTLRYQIHPESQSYFDYWEGCDNVTANNDCEISISFFNHSVTAHFGTELPDLVIDETTLTIHSAGDFDLGENKVAQGEPFSIQAKIYNIGGNPTADQKTWGTSKIEIFRNGIAEETIPNDYFFMLILSNSFSEEAFDFDTSEMEPGNYTFKYCVDTTDLMVEKDEDNNCINGLFEIIPTQALTVTKVPGNSTATIQTYGFLGNPDDNLLCDEGCDTATIRFPKGTGVTIGVTPGSGEAVDHWVAPCTNTQNPLSPGTLLSCSVTLNQDLNVEIHFQTCDEQSKDSNGRLPEGCQKPDIAVTSVIVENSTGPIEPLRKPEIKVGESVSISALVQNLGDEITKASFGVLLDVIPPPTEEQKLSFTQKSVNGLNLVDEKVITWPSFTPKAIGPYLAIVEADPGIAESPGIFQVDENPEDWTNNLNYTVLNVKPKPFYEIDVKKLNDGDGLVAVSNYDGASLPNSNIDCGPDCTAPFEEDSKVTLSAEPSFGSNFLGWKGACSGVGDCVISDLKADKKVDAEFELKSYVFTVTESGNSDGSVRGSFVQPNGDNQSFSCNGGCSFTLKHGTVITLNATYDDFTRLTWGGSCSGSSNSCRVTLTGTKSVTANFDWITYTLSLSKTGGGSGTFSGSYTSTGTYTIRKGTSVSIKGNPDSTSDFYWSGDCTGSGTCNLSMTGNKTIEGQFLRKYKTRIFSLYCIPGNFGDCGYGTVVIDYDGYPTETLSKNKPYISLTVPRDTYGTFHASPGYSSTLDKAWCSLGAKWCDCGTGGCSIIDFTTDTVKIVYHFKIDDSRSNTDDGKTFISNERSSETNGADTNSKPIEGNDSGDVVSTPEFEPEPQPAPVPPFNPRTIPNQSDLTPYALVYYPLRFKEGDKVSFFGTIFNEGRVPTGASKSSLAVFKKDGASWTRIELFKKEMEAFNRYDGKMSSYENEWTVPAGFAEYKFKFCADSETQVAESSESNNCKEIIPPVPSVKVRVMGDGQGTIHSISDPPRVDINCRGECSEKFQYYSRITLKAEAEAGSKFASWAGPLQKLSGDVIGGCNVLNSGNAEFALDNNLSTVLKCPEGASSYAGLVLSSPRLIEELRFYIPATLDSTNKVESFLRNQLTCDYAKYLKKAGIGTKSIAYFSGDCPWTEYFEVEDDKYRTISEVLVSGGTLPAQQIGNFGTPAEDDGAKIWIQGSLQKGLRYWLENRDRNSPTDVPVTFNVHTSKPSDFVHSTLEASKDGEHWIVLGEATSRPDEDSWAVIKNYDQTLYPYVRFNSNGGINHITDVTFFGRDFNFCEEQNTRGECLFTVVDQDKIVDALFVPHLDSKLKIEKVGEGLGVVKVGTGNKIDCGEKCDAVYSPNSEVIIRAVPEDGTDFLGWEGKDAKRCELSNGNKTCKIILNDDAQLIARFFRPYLRIEKVGKGDGLVRTVFGGKINCGETCENSFGIGETVSFIAEVNTWSRFVGWEGKSAGKCINNESNITVCSLKIEGEEQLSVRFEEQELVHRLKLNKKGGWGKITLSSVPKEGIAECEDSCVQKYLPGTQVTLKAVDAIGSRFLRWEGANSSLCSETSKTCSFVMNDNYTLSAVFEDQRVFLESKGIQISDADAVPSEDNGPKVFDVPGRGIHIAWLDVRSGTNELYLYDLAGGSAQKVTDYTAKKDDSKFKALVDFEFLNDSIILRELDEDETKKNPLIVYNIATGQMKDLKPDMDKIVSMSANGQKLAYVDTKYNSDGNVEHSSLRFYDFNTRKSYTVKESPERERYSAVDNFGERFVYNNLSQKRIAYEDYSEKESFFITDDDNIAKYSPRIYGDNIVYLNGKKSAFLYNLSERSLTEFDQDVPSLSSSAIYGNYAIWAVKKSDLGGVENKELYLYNIAEYNQHRITISAGNSILPDLYGRHLVWYEANNVDGVQKLSVRYLELPENLNNLLEDPVFYGDVNNDGRISAVDALAALSIAVKAPIDEGLNPLAADVDGKSGVSATDALLILKLAVGQLPMPNQTASRSVSPSSVTQSNKLPLPIADPQSFFSSKLSVHIVGMGKFNVKSSDKEAEQIANLIAKHFELSLPTSASFAFEAIPEVGFKFAGWELDGGIGNCEKKEICDFKTKKETTLLIKFERDIPARLDLKILDVKPTSFRKGKPAKFKTRVTNLGDTAEVAPVLELKIDEDNDGTWDKTFNYTEKLTTFVSDPRGRKKYNLKFKRNFWTPTKDGNYRYQFCVNVPGDKDNSNNCIQNKFSLKNGRSRSLKRVAIPITPKLREVPVTTTTSTTTTSTTLAPTTTLVTSTTISATTTTILAPTTTTLPVNVTTTTLTPTTTTLP